MGNWPDRGIIYIIGQVLGIVAPVLGLLSYQMKKQKNLLLLQLLNSIIFCLHYLMIGAISGMALNLVGLTRNAVFFRRKLRGVKAGFGGGQGVFQRVEELFLHVVRVLKMGVCRGKQG